MGTSRDVARGIFAAVGSEPACNSVDVDAVAAEDAPFDLTAIMEWEHDSNRRNWRNG